LFLFIYLPIYLFYFSFHSIYFTFIFLSICLSVCVNFLLLLLMIWHLIRLTKMIYNNCIINDLYNFLSVFVCFFDKNKNNKD
jgi:hypothetical protein